MWSVVLGLPALSLSLVNFEFIQCEKEIMRRVGQLAVCGVWARERYAMCALRLFHYIEVRLGTKVKTGSDWTPARYGWTRDESGCSRPAFTVPLWCFWRTPRSGRRPPRDSIFRSVSHIVLFNAVRLQHLPDERHRPASAPLAARWSRTIDFTAPR